MRWLPAAAFVLSLLSPSARADDAPLPSVPLAVPIAIVPDVQPYSFDLIDYRAEERQRPDPGCR